MKNFNALLFLLPILFTSCEKEKIEGPSLNDLYGELSIIEPFLVLGDSAEFDLGKNIYFVPRIYADELIDDKYCWSKFWIC